MKEHPYFKGYFVSEDGMTVQRLSTGKVLDQLENEFGYLTCSPEDPWTGRSKKTRVHRLVAQVYVDNPENLPEVNHKNGNKQNNHRDNLEWVTSADNKQHALRMGLYDNILGENNCSAILTDHQVHEICEKMQEGMRNKDLCKIYGVDKDTISSIRIGRNWKHITQHYSISVQRKERKSTEKVLFVARCLEVGMTDKEIAQKATLPIAEVSRIRRRKVFSYLTKDFEF